MIPVRRAALAATLALVMAAAPGAVAAAAAAPGEYGYGAQAAPAGQPLDLRAALTPVRKIEPEALAARAARPAPQVVSPPAAAQVETGTLTSAPMSAGAPIVFASASTRPTAMTPPREQGATPTPAPTPMTAPAPAPAPRAGQRPEWLETERVGAPYEAKGTWYVPTPDPGYAESGRASAIDAAFVGRRTASGETYAPDAIVAAHPTLPLPSLIQVTNLDTGRELIVRVVDRGPFEGRGLVALSPAALTALGAGEGGAARVHVRYLGPAPRRVGAEATAMASPAHGPQIAPSTAPAEPSPQIAEAAAPPRSAAGEGAFAVQVGAFGAAENAERARRIVASAGPASIDAAAGLHKVRVGPAATRAEAERLREVVAELGFPGAIVTRLR